MSESNNQLNCPPGFTVVDGRCVRVASEAIAIFAKAADFAAKKHRDQRRKDKEVTPYINHPIGAAYLATSVGGISDIVVLAALLLHDTIEDTNTTYEELVKEYGQDIAHVVWEVTDDKSLPKDERKRAQVAHVPHISTRAKLVKLCDKLYNLRDLINNPPEGYSVERIQGYCVWSSMVLQGARGINAALEKALDDEIFNASFTFEGVEYPCCPTMIEERHVFPKDTKSPAVAAYSMPAIKKGDSAIVLTDGEPDDLMAIAYLILGGVEISSVIVLEDRDKKDGWNRRERVSLLIDMLAQPKHATYVTDVTAFNDLDNASRYLSALVTAHLGRLQHIVSLGNHFPLLEMSSMFYVQRQSYDKALALLPVIQVWMYGSVNFRWAAKHVKSSETVIAEDPFRWIAGRLNAGDSILQFNVFETYGAFGTNNTLDAASAPALYAWIAKDDSPLASFLRQAANDWNKHMARQILCNLQLVHPVECADAMVHTCPHDRIAALKKMATDFPDSALNIKILVAIMCNPYEVVFADIGLVVAAMHFKHHFIPSRIDFATTGRPFTTATPLPANSDISSAQFETRYFDGAARKEHLLAEMAVFVLKQLSTQDVAATTK